MKNHGAGSHLGGRAFSLVELLVVISIVTLLVAMLLPSLHKAKLRTQQLVCTSSVRQIMLAYSSYLNEFSQNLYTFNFDASLVSPGEYYWNEAVLDPYITGGATRLFSTGCPGRDTAVEHQFYPGYPTWSYGVNGAVHGWSAPSSLVGYNYYFPHRALKLEDINQPRATHMFSDMIAVCKRYYNPGFYESYMFPRSIRHEYTGLSAVYADGHANFETYQDPTGLSVWNASWGYIVNCPTNGCYWHPFKVAANSP